MSNYNSLKTTIDANIKQNGRQEITGQILNSVLNQMVNILGTGYQFAGVATLDPATDPGTPDAKVFYIANGKGKYTNFGGLEVTEDDVVVLYWDSSWHKVSTGIASQEELTELESNTNPIVYTNDVDVNKVIRKLYINTDNYTGGLSLDGLCIERIVKNVEGYYGFRLQNSKGEDVADASVRTSSDVVEMTVNGIYIYVEYVWENITFPANGIFYLSVPALLLPPAFVPPTVTKFDITKIEQDITNIEQDITSFATQEELTKLKSNTNPLVYTDYVEYNKVIRKLYINTDNYTGSLSLDGLAIERIVKNVGGTYGFRLQNSKGEDVADIWGQTSSDIVEMTVNGIYVYVEYVWANMEEGMIRNYTRLLPCAFVPPTVTKFDITNINQDITELSKKLDIENKNIFSYNNNADAISRIISPYDEDNNLEVSLYVKRTSTFDNNPCLNFINVVLRNKSTEQTTLIHYCADDITPILMNNTYIGANHGDSDCSLLNIPNHGKTAQDIGSVWKDKNGVKCVLVGVPDENTLWFFGENLYSYPKFRFNSGIFTEGAILTHYSGATHQGDIILSSSGQTKQWYSSIKIKETKIIVDDTVVTESGDYKFKTLKICETYDIMNVASVIETIKNNAGTYTSTPNPNDVIAENVARFTIVYQFEGAGEWRIISNFTAYQDLELDYYGFTQQSPLDGYISMYIPKTLPIEGIDFRTIVPYTTGVTTKNLTSEYWENPMLPPDRWIQIGQSFALHSGYLFDYGVGGIKRKDLINNAFFLYDSRKIYPHGIDNKLSIKSGDNYSAVVWRSYLPTKDINNNGIIAINVFEFEGACYIYADFNLPGIYEIKIPNEYIGKVVDVFEKSDNITLLTEIASTTILVKMEQSLSGYGYLVAKL